MDEEEAKHSLATLLILFYTSLPFFFYTLIYMHPCA